MTPFVGVLVGVTATVRVKVWDMVRLGVAVTMGVWVGEKKVPQPVTLRMRVLYMSAR
jgi:phosphate/sulfate permease